MAKHSGAPLAHIGTSGWAYSSWRNKFFPAKLTAREYLSFTSRAFNSIEIDSTFYRMQTPERYQSWYDATPEGFLFAIKGSRYITHMLRLKDCETALGNFYASGILALQEKTGPFLWQFPAHVKLDMERFETFAKLLPRDFNEAVELARKHDSKLQKPYLKVEENYPLVHAFELRSDSFFNRDFLAMLRSYNIATVMVSSPKDWPLFTDVTANFLYIRMHGEKRLYSGSYGEAELKEWKRRISFWQKGRTPPDMEHYLPADPHKNMRPYFMYFDNTAKSEAPFDALKFMKMVGAKWEPSSERKVS